jgi:hypothetical protein
MANTGNKYDPRGVELGAGGEDLWSEQLGEEEWSYVVRSNLVLQIIHGELEMRNGGARIVD